MKKLSILLLIFIGFICISTVSATDNLTDVVSNDISEELQTTENEEIINSENENIDVYSYENEVNYDFKVKTVSKEYSNNDIRYEFSVYDLDNNQPLANHWFQVIFDNPPSDCPVSFYGDTDENGVGVVTFPSLPVGTYYIEIDAASWQEGGYSQKTLTIPPSKSINKDNVIKPTVKAPSMTVKPKAKKYFKITVKNSKNPVKNLKLKVKVYTGKKAKTYTLKTNKQGVVKIPTKKFKAGIHKVKITSANKKYSINKVSKFIVQPVKFRIGKYTGTFTLKQIKAIKKAQANWNYKTITVKSGKYYKFKYDGKTKKYPVKVSISAFGVDGSYPGNHKAFLESWSSAGPINVKKITIY